jgi:cold-inducible RNA-binding protein
VGDLAGTVGRILIRFKGDQVASNKLYVGNLSFNSTPEAVETLFAAVGEVIEVAIPTDRQTGRPRGFAFVTMADPETAVTAARQLDGTMLDGRALRVNEAQEATGVGVAAAGVIVGRFPRLASIKRSISARPARSSRRPRLGDGHSPFQVFGRVGVLRAGVLGDGLSVDCFSRRSGCIGCRRGGWGISAGATTPVAGARGQCAHRVGQQGQLPGGLDGQGDGALMLAAGACGAPTSYPASIVHVPPQHVDVLVVHPLGASDTELADLGAAPPDPAFTLSGCWLAARPVPGAELAVACHGAPLRPLRWWSMGPERMVGGCVTPHARKTTLADRGGHSVARVGARAG